MRKACLECVKKHLGSAAVFIKEVMLGYPNYDGYVYGELDHAADEAYEANETLAWIIRQHRINWAGDHHYLIPFEALFGYLTDCGISDTDLQIPDSVKEGIARDKKGNLVFDMDTRP